MGTPQSEWGIGKKSDRLAAAAGKPSAFIFLPAPNRASAVIFPAPLFALSVEAGNALLSVLLLRLLNASS